MRIRRCFLLLAVIIFELVGDGVYARDFDSPSDQKWQVQQAMQTIDRINDSKKLCERADTCPGLINQLFNNDEAGIYGLTSNHRQNCVDKHVKHASAFQDAKELKKYFAKTYSKNVTEGQQAVIASCAYGNDSFDRYAASKYYYSLSRLENGATQSIDQIAGIDSLLGKNTLEGIGCGQTIFPEVVAKCNQLKAGCKPDPVAAQKNMQILAEETKAEEHNYDEGKKYAEELENQISALEAPDMMYAKTGIPRSGYEKLPDLREKLAAVKAAIDLTEQNYPWLAGKVYRDARKEGKAYAAAVTAQLEYNRRELSSKYMGYRATAGCLIGMNDDQNTFCQLESVKKNLNDAPPPLGINSISDEAVSANEYLATQQCAQEAVVEKAHTKEIVDEVLINVALTAGTAALGPIAFAGRLAVIARGVNLTEGAAKLAIGAADAYWFADGVKHAKNVCYGQQEKEMQNAARPTPKNMCPGFDSTLSKMVHAADSCMSAKIWAGINGLPFVPAAVGVARMARAGKNVEVAADTARSIERASEPTARALPGKNILAGAEAKTTAKEIGNISEDEIRKNSRLSPQARIAKFDQYRQELAKKTGAELKALTAEQRRAVRDAHFESGNLFELKPEEIRRRTEILKKAGFSPAEIRLGMETGIFGQMQSQVNRIRVPRCNGCEPDMQIVEYSRQHSSAHFLESGKNPLANSQDALEKARSIRTSVFGDNVSLDEVMTAMKSPVSIQLDRNSRALLGANPEKNIVEALNASGEKHLAFEATLKIRGQNYEVKVVTCEVPVCAKGNQVLHKGDVVTVYPVCGPSVYVIPALTELRSSVPEKVTTRPCKNTAVGAAQAVSKNANRAKSSVAEAEIFDNAYAAGKFDDESRYVSVTDPKTRKSQKYEILSKEDDGSLLVKTEGGKIDKIKPSEVSIKPNKAAKFYFKARENISADTLIKDAQKAEKNLERPSFSKAEVNKNAQLSDSQKISKLESLRQEMAKQNKIEIPLLTQVQKDAMAKVHEDGAQVFNLTLSQKKNRIRILKEAGYSEDDIRLGMDAGIFGSSNDINVLSSEIRGDKTFLDSYQSGGFSQDNKYITVVPKPGASGVPLEILGKESDGKLLARNPKGEILRFSPEDAVEIKTNKASKLLFSYMDRQDKKRLEDVWSKVGGRPDYAYPGRRLPNQEVTEALRAQPKLARKIADMYQAIRKTPLENPVKDFRDIPHGKTHIGDPVKNVLAADPRIAGALKDSYNLRNDAESMAVYWRELMKDTAAEMKKSKLSRVKDAFAKGEIDYDTMVKVLSDRARARGEKIGVMTGTAEADFRKALREGPFFDQGQAGAKFHGRDVHAIMRDYEYTAVEKNLGKDSKKFYDFLASDGGRGYWDDLNEQGLRTSFASPPYVLKTLPLSEGMIGVRPKIKATPRSIPKPTKPEARLQRPKFSVDEVYKNADLEDVQKIEKFDQLRQEMMRLNKKPVVAMAVDEKTKLKKILAEIHADGGEVYHLTTEQKKRRVRFLKEVGYSDDEIRLGMDAGIFGQGKAKVISSNSKAAQRAEATSAVVEKRSGNEFIYTKSEINQVSNLSDDQRALKTEFEKLNDTEFKEAWADSKRDSVVALKADPVENLRKIEVYKKLGFNIEGEKIIPPSYTEFVENYVRELDRLGIPEKDRLLPALVLRRGEEYRLITPGIDPWPNEKGFEILKSTELFNIPSEVVLAAQKRGRFPLMDGAHDTYHFVAFEKNPEYARILRRTMESLPEGKTLSPSMKRRTLYVNEVLTYADPNKKSAILKRVPKVVEKTNGKSLSISDYQSHFRNMDEKSLVAYAEKLSKEFPNLIVDYGGGIVGSAEKLGYTGSTVFKEQAWAQALKKQRKRSAYGEETLDSPTSYASVLSDFLENYRKPNPKIKVSPTQNLQVIQDQVAKMEYFLRRSSTDMPMEKFVSGLVRADETVDPAVKKFIWELSGSEGYLGKSVAPNTLKDLSIEERQARITALSENSKPLSAYSKVRQRKAVEMAEKNSWRDRSILRKQEELSAQDIDFSSRKFEIEVLEENKQVVAQKIHVRVEAFSKEGVPGYAELEYILDPKGNELAPLLYKGFTVSTPSKKQRLLQIQRDKARLKIPAFQKEEVLKNAALGNPEKLKKFDQLRKDMQKNNSQPIKALTTGQKKKLASALDKIHSDGGEVFNLSITQKKSRIRILKEAGFDDNEIRLGMDAGVFGLWDKLKSVVSKKKVDANAYGNFKDAYKAGNLEGKNKYITETRANGSDLNYEIIRKSESGRILVRNESGYLKWLEPDANLRFSTSSPSSFKSLAAARAKNSKKWNGFSKPTYKYTGLRKNENDIEEALAAQPKFKDTLEVVRISLEEEVLAKPVKGFGDYSAGVLISDEHKTISKKTAREKLKTMDPKIRRTITAVANAGKDNENFSRYTVDLLKDTFAEMHRSKIARVQQAFAAGEFDYGTMLKVLSDRTRARGIKIRSTKSFDNDQFRTSISSGGFLDGAFTSSSHGRDSHLIQLDYTSGIVAENMSGDSKAFYDYLATDDGVGFWQDLYDTSGETLGSPETINRILRLLLSKVPNTGPARGKNPFKRTKPENASEAEAIQN